MVCITWFQMDETRNSGIRGLRKLGEDSGPPLAYGLHLATDGLKSSFSTSPDKLHASTAKREGLVWQTKIFFIFSRTWAKIPHA